MDKLLKFYLTLMFVMLLSCKGKEPVEIYLGMENGHEWVDLGLPSGIKWATCNVGASQTAEIGDYFAWGETIKKNEETAYCDSTYIYCDKEGCITKYITYPTWNIDSIDYKDVLEPSDDAATINWGGSWRTPTREEIKELCDNCSWEHIVMNGVNGCKVTSDINGYSIFLPTAGFKKECYTENTEYGFYWSSSLNADGFGDAFALECKNFGVIVRIERYFGSLIRPVCR